MQFNNGQIAAILHDLPSSAVQSYLDNKSFANYSLPTMMSNYLYVNPHKGMLTDAKNRTAVLQAIDVDELVKQTYFGRGKVAAQIYPPNMMAPQFAKQSVTHDPSVLTGLAGGLPADQKAITIGYDSSQSRQPVGQQPDSDATRRGGTHGQGAGLPDLGDLRLDRHRRAVGAGHLHRYGMAGRPVALHLGSHLVGRATAA